MKTGTKILLLIGILLLALGLTILQIANHRGISFNAGLVRVPGIDTVSDLSYDQKGYTVLTDGEESFPAGEVRTLKLDWSSGSVDVERYNGSTVLVREEAKRALKENECLRYKLSGGELSILPCANRVSNMPEKHLTVFIPQGLVLEGLAVDVSSADVKVSGVEVGGELSSKSSSGDFQAENLVCAAADLKTTSGDKSIDGLLCDKLKLSASSGAIRGTALVCGFVESESSSGKVSLAFNAAPAGIKIETSSGDVTLTFPRGTGINLLFDSSSGKLGGELVRGDLPVDVETSSGTWRPPAAILRSSTAEANMKKAPLRIIRRGAFGLSGKVRDQASASRSTLPSLLMPSTMRSSVALE